MIAIVDYGMGNLHSVWKAIKRIGFEAKVTSSAEDILAAERIIIPGVGHFKNGMEHLHGLKLIEPLNQKALVEKVPVLGICLGMQLFTRHSEEGDVDGLGWFDAQTVRFNLPKNDHNLRVPHMGWNNIRFSDGEAIFKNVPQQAAFYFVHSYHVVCNDPSDVLAVTDYGISFTSAIRRENIYGVQFHPEKSHDDGMTLLKNFVMYCHKPAVAA